LSRARRQVPEWTVYDDEIAAVLKGAEPLISEGKGGVQRGESIQEVVQKEEQKKKIKDEL